MRTGIGDERAIAYLAGWQQGPIRCPMRYGPYLWQNGEVYHYDAGRCPVVLGTRPVVEEASTH